MMRALVVSNMRPSPDQPGRGSFVRDHVAALARIDDVAVELYEFAPGPAALLAARLELRRLYGGAGLDIVHAHFGLTAWATLRVSARAHAVTLHGTDVRHPRTRRLMAPALRRMSLVATVSASLARELPGPRPGERRAVLPVGVELDRFHPIPREQARLAIGVEPRVPYVLFPADPRRAGKRFDRVRAVAGDTRLLTLGGVDPLHVPLFVNAANAVVVPSDAEGFGLAVLEALACDVPVIATPVGIHELACSGVAGTLCAPFDERRWRSALAPHIQAADPRIDGRARAELFSVARMARRTAAAWSDLLASEGAARRQARR
jgi:teichuronic acid biosynthesis glycosyltransferase TuaC